MALKKLNIASRAPKSQSVNYEHCPVIWRILLRAIRRRSCRFRD